ncbi:MAG: hypothetical protein R3B99_24005 [Polyangiales bacterium]
MRRVDSFARRAARFALLAARSAILAVGALASSCVDTELSVDLQVVGGEIVAFEDGSLESTVDIEVRVGRYALSGDDVGLSRIGFFADGDPVAELVPMRPGRVRDPHRAW